MLIDPHVLQAQQISYSDELPWDEPDIDYKLLYDMLMDLDEDDKELVLRYYWQGESMTAIGKTLEPRLTRQAVRYRLVRARLRLLESYKEHINGRS